MGRFTLVELMIVVAIIGILAAIAIPAFAAFQLKSKRAELPLIVDGLHAGVLAQHAETPDATDLHAAMTGDHCAMVPRDPGDADKVLVSWPPVTDCDLFGFRPDGGVRGVYSADYTEISGYSDIDDDSDLQSLQMATLSGGLSCDLSTAGCTFVAELSPSSCPPFNAACDVY